MIKDLFDLNDYDEFKKEVTSLIHRKEEFHPVIYKIIKKSQQRKNEQCLILYSFAHFYCQTQDIFHLFIL